MKQTIREKASALWEVFDNLRTFSNRGYYLREINGDEKEGFYIECHNPDNSPVEVIYWRNHGKASIVSGYSRYGSNFAQPTPEIFAACENILKMFIEDQTLYDLFNESQHTYDDKIRVSVDVCTSPIDFDNMVDGYYEETTFTINRKGQVFQSKPKHYSRSVLVALNID